MLTLVSPTIPAALLVIATAGGYAVATIGMKLTSHGLGHSGIALASLGFLAAFLAEMVLLRRAELSLVYIAIIAAETLLVLSYALLIGEGLSLRQAAGAALVLVGLAVATT
ncbi:hypothetical protein CSE45_2386 [Citreicella sp. SE45]|uniref:5-aminolevulinate synthase n=1 Tax=Salipiger thiooxidans TaxID=282683 RepID=A0A1G7DEV2_9RHOB|nr:hypothetical protein [Salipiger thiooxidans]EEX15543.1 hypothetical protein CSE45_2386 [Citreicella sp. SE45]MAU45682.1 5-aminolevulinate synthase [Salipiger sp.]NVK61565.1 5-aminolevulinate synthase [Paracoccaceae bacterium]SDE49959.1 hypothetical protein SAMN04488105_104175 [Salipiger thiooxidans]